MKARIASFFAAGVFAMSSFSTVIPAEDISNVRYADSDEIGVDSAAAASGIVTDQTQTDAPDTGALFGEDGEQTQDTGGASLAELMDETEADTAAETEHIPAVKPVIVVGAGAVSDSSDSADQASEIAAADIASDTAAADAASETAIAAADAASETVE